MSGWVMTVIGWVSTSNWIQLNAEALELRQCIFLSTRPQYTCCWASSWGYCVAVWLSATWCSAIMSVSFNSSTTSLEAADACTRKTSCVGRNIHTKSSEQPQRQHRKTCFTRVGLVNAFNLCQSNLMWLLPLTSLDLEQFFLHLATLSMYSAFHNFFLGLSDSWGQNRDNTGDNPLVVSLVEKMAISVFVPRLTMHLENQVKLLSCWNAGWASTVFFLSP